MIGKVLFAFSVIRRLYSAYISGYIVIFKLCSPLKRNKYKFGFGILILLFEDLKRKFFYMFLINYTLDYNRKK
jgi:hypothetical protein